MPNSIPKPEAHQPEVTLSEQLDMTICLIEDITNLVDRISDKMFGPLVHDSVERPYDTIKGNARFIHSRLISLRDNLKDIEGTL